MKLQRFIPRADKQQIGTAARHLPLRRLGRKNGTLGWPPCTAALLAHVPAHDFPAAALRQPAPQLLGAHPSGQGTPGAGWCAAWSIPRSLTLHVHRSERSEAGPALLSLFPAPSNSAPCPSPHSHELIDDAKLLPRPAPYHLRCHRLRPCSPAAVEQAPAGRQQPQWQHGWRAAEVCGAGDGQGVLPGRLEGGRLEDAD